MPWALLGAVCAVGLGRQEVCGHALAEAVLCTSGRTQTLCPDIPAALGVLAELWTNLGFPVLWADISPLEAAFSKLYAFISADAAGSEPFGLCCL